MTRNVPRNAVVAGNPARIISYAGARHPAEPSPSAATDETGPEETRVEGVILRRLDWIES